MKLIAIDLDGTLLNSRHQIVEANRMALKELSDKGIEIIIATGRSPVSGIQMFRELGIDGHLIALNGAYIGRIISGKESAVIEKSYIKNEIAKLAVRSAAAHKITIIANRGESNDRVIEHEKVQLVQEFQKKRSDLTDCSLEDILKKIESKEDYYLKIAFTDQNKKNLMALKYELNVQGIQVVASDEYYVELMPMGVNKGTSLKKVVSRLKMSLDQVVAIGDQENDMEMLQQSGIGVAMGNAKGIVKQIADFETLDNNQAGVAFAIRKFF